jgi:hypothetical protein
LWRPDHLANSPPLRTVRDFNLKVANLISFLGHPDALKVATKGMVDWTDTCVMTGG